MLNAVDHQPLSSACVFLLPVFLLHHCFLFIALIS